MAAVAAHGLGGLEPAALSAVRSGIEMQIWHSLVLLFCGLWAPRGGRLADLAAVAFAAGTVLFCSAVYGLGLFDVRFGMTAPIGGTLLMIGWCLLGISALVGTRK